MKPSRLMLLGAALLASLALAACGDSTVSADEMSTQVQASLEDAGGPPIESVDCPEVPAEEGEVFDCEATRTNGGTLKIEGEITSADPDSDTVNFTVRIVGG
jgi:hypothetical protein